MQALLFSKYGAMKGYQFEISEESSVGRSDDNSVVLNNDAISGKHARLYFDRSVGKWFLEDLGSTNGTMLDGAPLHGPERLDRLHVITFAGSHDFFFQVIESDDRPSQKEPGISKENTDSYQAIPAAGIDLRNLGASEQKRSTAGGIEPIVLPAALRKPGKPKSPTGDRFRVRVTNLGPGMVFELKPGQNQVGRGSDCTVCIKDPEISRRHAVIYVEDNRLLIEDGGSTNRTFLEKVAVEGKTQMPVGAQIGFGKIEAVVEVCPEEPQGEDHD